MDLRFAIMRRLLLALAAGLATQAAAERYQGFIENNTTRTCSADSHAEMFNLQVSSACDGEISSPSPPLDEPQRSGSSYEAEFRLWKRARVARKRVVVVV